MVVDKYCMQRIMLCIMTLVKVFDARQGSRWNLLSTRVVMHIIIRYHFLRTICVLQLLNFYNSFQQSTTITIRTKTNLKIITQCNVIIVYFQNVHVVRPIQLIELYLMFCRPRYKKHIHIYIKFKFRYVLLITQH